MRRAKFTALIAGLWCALTMAPLLGCAPDEDDGGDKDDDDSPDDDTEDWEGNPRIETDGADALEALTDAARDAVDAVAPWLQLDLLASFARLSEDVQDKWAEMVLNPAEERFRDELAFLVAHLAENDLEAPGLSAELLEENVASVYAADEELAYVTLVEVEEKADAGGPYTTAQYELPEGPLTVDREIYYWFVLHPRLEDEGPSYINPATGRAADPPDGVFWRDYLLHHADPECPGAVPCATLASMLAGETVLWNGLNDAAENGAVGAVSRWVTSSMVFGAGQERPIQPVRIYTLHRGNCGEYADLTSAAGRAALIPTVNVAAYADDHTWNEFYDGAWHQWEPVNDYVDEFEHYDAWGGGGPGLAGVYAVRGDGFSWNRTPDYSPTCTVNVTVTDQNGQPVEGARVTAAGMIYGMYLQHFADWTDAEGKVSALLGDENQFFYMQVHSPLGTVPAGDPERVVAGSETDAVYEWAVTLPGERTALAAEVEESTEGRYVVTVRYDFPARYLLSRGIVRGLDFLENSRPGAPRILLLDPEAFADYEAGRPFTAAADSIGAQGEITTNIPRPGEWTVVVTNEEQVSVVQLGTVEVRVWPEASPDDAVSDSRLIRLAPGERFLFRLRGL